MATLTRPTITLPIPDAYEDGQEYLRALAASLEEQLQESFATISDAVVVLENTDPGSFTRPVTDSSGRDIITDDGLIIYNGMGTRVVDENIVNIDTSELADTAVTTAKIADLAVDNAKLAALSVDSAKLADSAVTSTKIANLAVGTAAIANAAVGTAQIANLAVTEALIGNAAIVEAKIADLAVTNAKVAGDLSANKITAGTLSAARIATDGLTVLNVGGQLESQARAGTNLYDSSSNLLEDIDVRNDQLVVSELGAINANPSFRIPRVTPVNSLGPASWLATNSSANCEYVSDSERDALKIAAGAAVFAINTAFSVEPGVDYEFSILAKHDGLGSGTPDVRIVCYYTTNDLATGEVAVGPSLISGAGADPASFFTAFTGALEVVSPTPLTTSYAVYSGTWTAPAGVKWASMMVDPSDNSGAEVHVEWAIVRQRSTSNGTTIDSSGNIVGSVNISGGSISVDKTSASDATSGIWLGTDGASGYDFRIGSSTSNEIHWDGSAGTLSVRGTLNADDLSSGTIDASSIGVTNINASNINTGTLNAATVGVTNLNANNISTGTLDADRLSIDGVTLDTSGGNLIIRDNGVDTAQLASNAIGATQVVNSWDNTNFSIGTSTTPGFKTIQSASLDIPNPKTGSVVLAEFTCSLYGFSADFNGGGASRSEGTDQDNIVVRCRLLDNSDVEVGGQKYFYFTTFRRSVLGASEQKFTGTVSATWLVPNSVLDAGVSNTFEAQLYEIQTTVGEWGDSGQILVYDPTLRVTVLNKAE